MTFHPRMAWIYYKKIPDGPAPAGDLHCQVCHALERQFHLCRNGVLLWLVSTLVDTVDPRHAWMLFDDLSSTHGVDLLQKKFPGGPAPAGDLHCQVCHALERQFHLCRNGVLLW